MYVLCRPYMPFTYLHTVIIISQTIIVYNQFCVRMIVTVTDIYEYMVIQSNDRYD